MTSLIWLLLVYCLADLFEVDSIIVGAGTSLPNPVYQDALFAHSLENGSASIIYKPTGALHGKCRIMSGLGTECDSNDHSEPEFVDFATSESILEPSDYAAVHDLQLYPTLATAIVPIFNLESIRDLVLTPSTLARIFSGHIHHWDDPEIIALNPDFVGNKVLANRPIETIVPSEHDGTTEIFKKALSSFDATFSTEVGTAAASTWGRLNATVHGNPHTYVLMHPFTIGYTSLDFALDFQLSVARLQKNTGPVTASLASTQYALLELGLTFGNNGDAPERLTADLHNAQGVHAWPIVGYTYLIMRKSTLREGATCDEVRQTVNFWMWFWESEDVARLAELHNFLPLPTLVRDIVMKRFEKDITCDGHSLWKDKKVVVPSSGIGWVEDIFVKTSIMYHIIDPNVEVEYTSLDVDTEDIVEQSLENDMFVISHIPWTDTKTHMGVKLTLAGIGFVVISRFSLVLDVITLAKIFDGTITTWLHPDVLALNPNGIKDEQGFTIADKTQPIILMRGPFTTDDSLEDILKKYLPSYKGAAIRAAITYDDEMVLRSAVTVTPFALSATVLMDDFDHELRFATMQRQGDNKVEPNWMSILACATPEVYNANTYDYALQDSEDPSCYPLSVATYVTLLKSECNMVTDASRTAAVAFVEWLFSNTNFEFALRQQNVAPLCFLPHINHSNGIALENVTCNVRLRTGASKLWWIILAVVVTVMVVVIGIGGGLLYWKATAKMRAMRKQFSNDNVAQECAQAIAEFNLEAVAWLKDVPHPNKIQQSFIQIVRLLTEVRPFIPDQLLASLTRGDDTSGTDTVDEATPGPLTTSVRNVPLPQNAESPLTRASSYTTETSSSTGKTSSNLSVGTPTEPRRPSRKQVNPSKTATSEWSKRRCVYMVVQFGFSERMADSAQMGQILSDIVTIGKGHGATIGQVAIDSAVFHWGVVKHVAGSALQATTAAMEICAVRLTLPLELQQSFKLRVGITHGICDIATVSAAGHRFFVMGGPEVSLAANIVSSAVGAPYGCDVLMTQAVYQEVQYAVCCMPRLWFNGTLMYEPMQLREGSGHADEWMYELKNLDGEEAHFSSSTLLLLFQMVRTGEPATAVKAEADRIKQQFGSEMSAHDLACLDRLISTIMPV